MQITQTNADGLKREFKIVIGAGDIEKKVQERLSALRERVQLPGFRPGKAPVNLLKRQYGRAVLGEVLEETVSSATDQAIRDHALRPALQPKVEVTKFDEGADLEYTLAVEVLPDITPGDFKAITVERLVPTISDEEVEKTIRRLAEQQKSFEKVEGDRPAASGDALLIDFVGKVDGVAFPGGSATDFTLELGSGQFILGFEDQLVGARAGEDKVVEVTFPAEYGNKNLAGKAATFEVKVKELRQAKPVALDDELAKRMGLESFAQLQDAVRKQIEQEYAQVARTRVKRTLLDALAKRHDFAVPPGMVDLEFEQIWKRLQDEGQMAAELASSGKTEDELKQDYRNIAERRVRLGLLLAEVGRQNNIEVKPEEVSRAMMEQARRFPGQERQVMEFFQKSAEAMAQLRAPIFEDKVIDFILEMAQVTQRAVSPEELLRAAEEEDQTAA